MNRDQAARVARLRATYRHGMFPTIAEWEHHIEHGGSTYPVCTSADCQVCK